MWRWRQIWTNAAILSATDRCGGLFEGASERSRKLKQERRSIFGLFPDERAATERRSGPSHSQSRAPAICSLTTRTRAVWAPRKTLCYIAKLALLPCCAYTRADTDAHRTQ